MPRPQKLSLETAKHVAELARLKLTDKELHKFSQDLNNILAAFEGLDKLKIPDKTEPSFQPLPVLDILRPDVLESTLGQEKALAQTQHKQKGYFKGPKSV